MDIKDVENLAEMARLDLAPEEKAGILSDMKGILEYVKQIESVEVGNVDMQYQHYNAWREDEIDNNPQFSKDIILEQFPEKQDGFLKVKKIL